MRLLMLLLLFGCFSTLISSRPAVEENESETIDAEEEGSEDSEDDEYLSEDQVSASDEAINQDGIIENSQEQKLSHENKFLVPDGGNGQNKASYGTFSDIELEPKKEKNRDKLLELNFAREASFSAEMERPNTHTDESNNAAELKEESQSGSNIPQRLESRHVNAGPVLAADYSDESVFKNTPENLNRDNSNNIHEHLSPGEHSNSLKQYYKRMHIKNMNSIQGRKHDYSCNERDRRQAQSLKPVEKCNEDINENNENAIIKNIKKLSNQDLEELLDSLPEDKKDLLRKIMDKREITKKAGAVDDNNDQSDTRKVEESFSVESNTVLGISSDTDSSESKHAESDETSTKAQETENSTGKSENKSGAEVNVNEGTLEVSIEAVTSNIDKRKLDANSISKETFKSDNKREINSDSTMESVLKDINFNDDENSYDLSLDQMAVCMDNEGKLESKNEESNAQKREVPLNLLKSEILSDSMKSLEDSFPSANSHEDAELGMEPLIRVKRTKLGHRVAKRDLPRLISDQRPFVTEFEDEKAENVEENEFKDKSFLADSSAYERNYKQAETRKDALLDEVDLHKKVLTNSVLQEGETDKSSLGSDTDNVLSNIEGIDENIMCNSKSRNKRIVKGKVCQNNTTKLIRNGRTISPMVYNDNISLSDNCLGEPQFRIEKQEPFETELQNSEDLSRPKRVKRNENESLVL